MYWVYILTNNYHTTLYTGVTNNILRRIVEHKSGEGSKFAHKYNLHKLVNYELHSEIETAIFREKQIKAGSRNKKIELIESINPDWVDIIDDI